MASGGKTHLLNCPICFEGKDGRTPRALQCQHSFYTECLIQWYKACGNRKQSASNKIECPVCKTTSPLPPGGVQGLPVDFKVSEASDVISALDNQKSCQKCSRVGRLNSAKALCVDCNYHFCEDCASDHLQSQIFADHKIVRALCKLHCGEMKYVCLTCKEPLCSVCVIHGDHNEHQVTDTEGWLQPNKSKLQEEIEIMKIEVQNLTENVRVSELHCEEHYDLVDAAIANQCESVKAEVERLFNDARVQHRAQCEEHSAKLHQRFNDAIQIGGEAIAKCSNILEKDTTEFIKEFHDMQKNVQRARSVLRTAGLSLPQAANLTPNSCSIEGAQDIFVSIQSCSYACSLSSILNSGEEYAPPKELFKLDCDKEGPIDNPWNLCAWPDGSVIVCQADGGKVCSVLLDGSVQDVYSGDKTLAPCVKGAILYLAKSDGTGVIKISPSGDTDIIPLDLNVPCPFGLGVQGEDFYFLYLSGVAHRCLKRPGGRQIIDGDKLHGFLHVHQTIPQMLIVTDLQTKGITVYTTEGKALHRLGAGQLKFKEPTGITMLANGHILVADRKLKKIFEFTLDGSFIRELLTEKDGLSCPACIAYCHPYLWISENDVSSAAGSTKASLRLFKF